MKVLFLTFIPSPYRLSFFEELGKHCDLTVLFERGQSKYRKGNWKDFQFNGYKGIILKGITAYLQDRFCPGCLKYVLNRAKAFADDGRKVVKVGINFSENQRSIEDWVIE